MAGSCFFNSTLAAPQDNASAFHWVLKTVRMMRPSQGMSTCVWVTAWLQAQARQGCTRGAAQSNHDTSISWDPKQQQQNSTEMTSTAPLGRCTTCRPGVSKYSMHSLARARMHRVSFERGTRLSKEKQMLGGQAVLAQRSCAPAVSMGTGKAAHSMRACIQGCATQNMNQRPLQPKRAAALCDKQGQRVGEQAKS